PCTLLADVPVRRLHPVWPQPLDVGRHLQPEGGGQGSHDQVPSVQHTHPRRWATRCPLRGPATTLRDTSHPGSTGGQGGAPARDPERSPRSVLAARARRRSASRARAAPEPRRGRELGTAHPDGAHRRHTGADARRRHGSTGSALATVSGGERAARTTRATTSRPRAPAPAVPGGAARPVAPRAPGAAAAPPAPRPRAAASAPESAIPFLPVDAAPAAPVPAAPVPAAPMAAAAAPVAAPVAPQVAVDLPGPAPLPDVGLAPATLRDPHAAFRRRSPRTRILPAAAAVVMGGAIHVASRGEEKKAATRAPNVTSESAKPAIGVAVAAYRSDAHEPLPGKPASAGDAPSRNEDTTGQPAAEVGSSKDFAERFKAASGRERREQSRPSALGRCGRASSSACRRDVASSLVSPTWCASSAVSSSAM